MIVVGGRSKVDIMDCHVLTFEDTSLTSATWSNPQIDGFQPSPRRRHTMCSSGNKIFLFGGFDGKKFLNDVHAFQLPLEICSDNMILVKLKRAKTKKINKDRIARSSTKALVRNRGICLCR